jgi:hypothetical protein
MAFPGVARFRAILIGASIATLPVACGSSRPTAPLGDDTARLIPTVISGPFTLVDASVKEQPGSPPNLVYGVSISNSGSSPIQIQYGGCWAFVRLYARADRAGTPISDNGPPDVACTLDLHTAAIPAGATVQISSQTLLDPVVPVGHYYASVAFAPNGAATVLPAGEIDVVR